MVVENEQEAMLCMICSQEKVEGIHIYFEWICDDCEAEIVRTEVEDERYPFFIYQLRKIWSGDHHLQHIIRQSQ